jgi:hypothetical protein
VAYLSWDQIGEADAWVEISFDEDAWLRSPTIEAASGEQDQILLGIPYAMEVSYRLMNDGEDGAVTMAEGSFTTGEQPEEIEDAELLTSDEARYDAARPYYISSINTEPNEPWWVFIVDRRGRMVWAMEIPQTHVTLQPRPSFNGDAIALDYNSFWRQFDEGAASRVEHMKIDGTVVQSLATPGLQHAFADLPDGSVVFGAETPNEILMKAEPDGTLTQIWSCPEWLDSIGQAGRTCSSNHLSWDQASDTFLFSFFTLETVVQIDHSTGESLRWFGHANESWPFEPLNSAFYWQHGPYFLDNGNMLLSTRGSATVHETVVREYKLNEEDGTLEQVWTFGRGEGIHSEAAGGAERLPGGNTLHHFGETPRIREITEDGQVVWDLSWEDGNRQLGYVTSIEDLYALAP